MLRYLIFLLSGIFLGFLIKNKQFDKFQKYLLPISIMVLLFFMGVGIGKDPYLNQKVAMFGYSAFVLSALTVFFSVIAVWLIMRLFGRK